MENKFAPIILFTYNRPWHTAMVLDALSENDHSRDSDLIIFCDGLKNNADEIAINNHNEVKEIISKKYPFKSIEINIHSQNKGLSASIIDGVSEIMNRYEKCIVLEDDIVPSKGFLKYMNEALAMYEFEENVGCVHAWNYTMNLKKYDESTFFLPGADCWGWATWKRAWRFFQPNSNILLQIIEEKKLKYILNRNDTHYYLNMLKAQSEGRIDSWAIRWHASLIIENKFCLHPTVSIVKNIGLDGSGTHCGESSINQQTVEYIYLNKIEIRDCEQFYPAYKETLTPKDTYKRKVLSIVKQIIPPILLDFRFKFHKIINNHNTWSGDYDNWENALAACSGYDSSKILEKCKESMFKVINKEAKFERDSVLFYDKIYNWPLIYFLNFISKGNNEILSVLDFGGSLGSTYYQIKDELFALKKIKWCIVEQKQFVEEGKNNFENEVLKFYFDINDCLLENSPNVLLLSSTIQYLHKPLEFIDFISNLNFDYIIIDRTPYLNSERSVIIKQTVPSSIYEASYPMWLLSKSHFEGKLIKNYIQVFSGISYDETIVKWNGVELHYNFIVWKKR